MNNIPIIEKNFAEKYSSAISLSDMEIFIFPEFLYSLVLSNIMSPIIWEWKNRSMVFKNRYHETIQKNSTTKTIYN